MDRQLRQRDCRMNGSTTNEEHLGTDHIPSAKPRRFSLHYHGHLLEVESPFAGLARVGRLFVDGKQVDERKVWFESARLSGGGVSVIVDWTLLNQVTRCVAIPAGTDEKAESEVEIPFQPPVGSYADRMQDLERVHPSFYASRHVAIAIVQALIRLLGIGALVIGLLPRIDLPTIPWPDFTIPFPNWLRTFLDRIDIVSWILPDLSLSIPDWVRTFVNRAKWWIPILIAVFVAVEEYERRQKRNRPTQANEPPADSQVSDAGPPSETPCTKNHDATQRPVATGPAADTPPKTETAADRPATTPINVTERERPR